MTRYIAVTGTDTGVGKTIVTAALAAKLAGQGLDVLAVKPVQTGAGARSAHDFTTSRARLFAAIDTFSGRKIGSATQSRIDDYYRQRDLGREIAPRDTEEGERAHYARNTLRTLRSAAQILGNIQGRRKAVVWFSEGTDFMTENPFTAQSSS